MQRGDECDTAGTPQCCAAVFSASSRSGVSRYSACQSRESESSSGPPWSSFRDGRTPLCDSEAQQQPWQPWQPGLRVLHQQAFALH
eukprot:CAMPEP_0115113514 /NCGR_PEP_ID=MMETSP0227-20121206/41422_1 /TAXON_ID=89957 /ORGANISM="Polarella glacialis, Strain CCMP 1383" /LENGTH=85 /DNA_ID=CAMNT_0002513569 /DNA_START=193 /DNA_END=450 /DNA_ORIENTATION=-